MTEDWAFKAQDIRSRAKKCGLAEADSAADSRRPTQTTNRLTRPLRESFTYSADATERIASRPSGERGIVYILRRCGSSSGLSRQPGEAL
jgi:hypothetical protein